MRISSLFWKYITSWDCLASVLNIHSQMLGFGFVHVKPGLIVLLVKFQAAGSNREKPLPEFTHSLLPSLQISQKCFLYTLFLGSYSFLCFCVQTSCEGHQEFWESADPAAAALSSRRRGHEDLPHSVRVPGPARLQKLHPPHHPTGHGHPPAGRQSQQSFRYHVWTNYNLFFSRQMNF